MAANDEFSRQVRECADRLAETGPAVLGMLFDLTAKRLVRFATTIAHHQHDAEDAVQVALTTLAIAPRRLRDADCPWAYLLRMVRNETLIILRRRKRISTKDDLSDLTTYCPVDELEREESYRAVWSALRLLPAEQAQIVVLKIWEELTFAQIAEVLDLSPNTVASRYQYGMVKLTSHLKRSDQAEVGRD